MRTLLLLLFIGTLTATAQVEARRPLSTFDLPEFFVDAISFSSGDSLTSRLDIYIQVPYDAIQFLRSGDKYAAAYDVTLNFLDEDGTAVSEKGWTERVTVPVFEFAQGHRMYSMTQRSVNLTPGIYTMRSQVRDEESKKVFTVVKKIVVGNYATSSISVSDLMLVNRITADGDKRTLSPNVSGNIGENRNSFSVFFEIYDQRIPDSLEVRYSITDGKGKEILSRTQSYRSRAQRNQMITRFDSMFYASGSYQLNVEVRSLLDDPNEIPAMKQRGFVVRWGNMPISISDLSLAIRQLKYLATNVEISAFDTASTDESRRVLFDAFWKKRDPNPATARNEYMEEYYSRVEYANKSFSHYQPGWNTDMGMVFILFGSPNNVERHPFDIDSKPYEVWSYFDYNRTVVFIDETGFGDYKLLTPIWDMLQRLKASQ